MKGGYPALPITYLSLSTQSCCHRAFVHAFLSSRNPSPLTQSSSPWLTLTKPSCVTLDISPFLQEAFLDPHSLPPHCEFPPGQAGPDVSCSLRCPGCLTRVGPQKAEAP